MGAGSAEADGLNEKSGSALTDFRWCNPPTGARLDDGINCPDIGLPLAAMFVGDTARVGGVRDRRGKTKSGLGSSSTSPLSIPLLLRYSNEPIIASSLRPLCCCGTAMVTALSVTAPCSLCSVATTAVMAGTDNGRQWATTGFAGWITV